MVNESGRFPEVCKKSLQAMAADMQGAIPDSFWNTYTIEQLRKFTPQQLETCGRLVTPLRIRRGEVIDFFPYGQHRRFDVNGGAAGASELVDPAAAGAETPADQPDTSAPVSVVEPGE